MEGQTRDASFVRTTRWLQKPTLYLIIFSLCVSVLLLAVFFPLFKRKRRKKNYTQILPLLFWLIGIVFVLILLRLIRLYAQFSHSITLRTYVCMNWFCVCWTWFQCTCCLSCGQCSRFSWTSIAVNALAPSFVVVIPLNSSRLHIRTYIYIYVYRASLLKYINIKQINYRLHSRTWRAQEIRQWRKWFQNPTDFSLCISNRSSSNDSSNRDNSNTETFSTLAWVRLYFDIYSHINPLYIYRL